MSIRFKRLQFDNITILRGLSCLMIIAIHSHLPLQVIDSQVGVFLVTIGHMPIRLFFFLSGMCLAMGFLKNKYQLHSKGILNFYKRRLTRIFPFYLLIISYLFLLTPKPTQIQLVDFVRLLTFSSSSKTSIFSASYLWFISTIVQLYLVAPFGFFIIRMIKKCDLFRRILIFILIVFLASIIKFMLIAKLSSDVLTTSWQANIDIFFAGMVLATYNQDLLKLIKKKDSIVLNTIISLLFLAFSIVSFLGSWYLFLHISQKPIFDIVIVPASGVLMAAILLSAIMVKNTVKFPAPHIIASILGLLVYVVQQIGLYSYEIYLLHQPLLNAFNLKCLPRCNALLFGKNVAIIAVFASLIAFSYKKISAVINAKIFSKS